MDTAGDSDVLHRNAFNVSEKIAVINMFPLSNWRDTSVVLYAMLYACLFLIGICGNVSVITLIRHVHSAIPYDSTMIFILFLCCVDLISVVPLPMAISDQLLGFWMFGSLFCKLYRTVEHVGRALSTFVLAAMAFDRFQRVCYPHRKTSRATIVVCLTSLTLFTFLLLSPLIVYTISEEIILKEVHLDEPIRILRIRIFKCVDTMEGNLFTIFTLYMFTIGFAIPVFLIILFYGLLVRRLFIRSRSIPTSRVPVNRIAGYTMAISVFFVVCWCPYWIAALYGLYRWQDANYHASATFIYIMYGIHALPYVNSASNWLLYGLLNGQLIRRASHQKKSFAALNDISYRQPILTPAPVIKNIKEEEASSGIIPHSSDSIL